MYYLRQNYSTVRNKLFLALIIDNLLVSIVNIISVYTISYPKLFSLGTNYFINELYLFLYNLLAIIFLLYISSLVKSSFYRKCIYCSTVIIFIVETIIIFTTSYTHFVIYFDEDLNYKQAVGVTLLYVMAISMMLVADFIVIAIRKRLNVYQVVSITGFLVGVILSVIIQAFMPEFLITNFVLSMVLFFVYSAFENPAYFLYNETQCYNRRAFLQTIRRKNNKNHFYKVIAVKIIDYNYYEYMMGQRNAELLSFKIAERLNRYFKFCTYEINANEFAIVVDDNINIEETINEIENAFKEKFSIASDERIVEIDVDVDIVVIPIVDLKIEGVELEEIIHNVKGEVGKHVYVMDDIEMVVEKIRRTKKISQIMDKALKEDGFTIYYQPIYDTNNDMFHGAEALLRLIDKELGFIGPDEFIPIAEKNGQIVEMGEMVLRKVCEFLRDSKCLQLGVKYIDVNLSPIQCRYEKLAEKYLDIIASYGVDTKCVNLEITETAETEFFTVRVLKNIMECMVQQGVGFSIDDYGSGFATIDYLLEFPAETVKIDKSILWQAMESEEAMIILEYTVKLLKAIGKKIVVEGVENEEMKQILLDFGCDYLQGYLYSRPVPEDDFIEFLEKENKRAEL